MKKVLLLASFAVLAAFGANAQTVTTTTVTPTSTTSGTIDPSAPVMKFDTDTMNFGTVTQGTIVERDYKFTNTGKTPLVITSAAGSCHCTVPTYPTEPIAPGKTGTIHVRFDSNGKMGYQDKTATINSNNAGGTVVLHLRGTVITAPAAPAVGTTDPNRPAAPTATTTTGGN